MFHSQNQRLLKQQQHVIMSFRSDVRETSDFLVKIPCSTYQHRVSGVGKTPELKYYHIFPHDKLHGVKHEAYEWVEVTWGWAKLSHSCGGCSSSIANIAQHNAWAGAEASEAFPEVQNFVVKYVYSLMWWTGERLWKIISFYCRRRKVRCRKLAFRDKRRKRSRSSLV